LIDFKTKLVNDICGKARLRIWMEKRIYVVNSSIFRSEIGDVLALRPDCDFAVIWDFDHERKNYSVSLRSNEEKKIDVSAVAKKFGGGGHACAAGCQWNGAHIEDMFLSTGAM